MDQVDQMFVDDFANKLNMDKGDQQRYASEKKRRVTKNKSINFYTMQNDPNLHLDDDEMIKF